MVPGAMILWDALTNEKIPMEEVAVGTQGIMLGVQDVISCGGPHRIHHRRRLQQRNIVEACTTTDNNKASNHLSSQDTRVSSNIYPPFLAIPLSTPLRLGSCFVAK